MARRRIENTGVQLNEEQYTHQPKPTNRLKIRLDDLRTFEALTANQQKFFDIYKRGGYLIGMLGSPGTGKCLGADEVLELYVSEEVENKLKDKLVDQ